MMRILRFVRDVCTRLINYNPCPNKTELIHVAKKVMEKYPCMADEKIFDSSSEWVCNCINMLEVRKPLHVISICAGLLMVTWGEHGYIVCYFSITAADLFFYSKGFT
jgi:hypothetical protein